MPLELVDTRLGREKEGAVREDTFRKGRESENATGPVRLYVSMLATTSHPGCG